MATICAMALDVAAVWCSSTWPPFNTPSSGEVELGGVGGAGAEVGTGKCRWPRDCGGDKKGRLSNVRRRDHGANSLAEGRRAVWVRLVKDICRATLLQELHYSLSGVNICDAVIRQCSHRNSKPQTHSWETTVSRALMCF